MFKTFQGVTEDAKAEIYLRPETAQGIFVNFKNVQRTTRRKLPMGIAQIGKSFRNEITPGNFVFRTREFEQMEMEFFLHLQPKKLFLRVLFLWNARHKSLKPTATFFTAFSFKRFAFSY